MDGTAKEGARRVYAKARIRFISATKFGQSRSVLAVNFKPAPAAGNQMFDDGFGPDRSFRNKKIKLGAHAHGPRNWRGQK